MRTHERGGTAKTFLVLAALCLPAIAGAFDKKVRVATDYAHIYLHPSEESPVIETVEQGTVLSLLSGGKIKKCWFYVCFRSAKTGATKSGYVLDGAVELLFDPLRTITIQEDRETLRVNYAPRTFDEMKWGVSKKFILEMEGRPASQERIKGQDVMRYNQKVINMDCLIEYIFAGNKLSQTKFSFVGGDPEDKNTYLQNYRKVKDALVQKFGRPLEENINWVDSSYRDDFSRWGEAVSLGHLVLNSRWLTPETEIVARLTGGKNDVELVVEYSALRLKELAWKSQTD